MKSIKEYMLQSAQMTESDEQDEQEEDELCEVKFISSPDEIDASNPIVKKIQAACKKNGYQLKKAFGFINSKGKPSGRFTISVAGDGAGYHPEIRFNMNAKPGAMFYLHVDLSMDMVGGEGKAYADGLAKGVAMIEVLNKLDYAKLPGVL